ncbi:CPCC family cysteine-rich protein [Streptomyces syringium]|uniref:CPCC family cysteine-rich protein n=1 Tax=Streptomyces syringium TaxID=76729 RepID=UPI00103278CE|nr:CPCC family cysteine-rich protein [Streptomyces syringium]
MTPGMACNEPSSRPSDDTAHGVIACPCCFQQTLEERANFEICPECGWEDDGQDDADAHVVRGGPNGHRISVVAGPRRGGEDPLRPARRKIRTCDPTRKSKEPHRSGVPAGVRGGT